MRRVAILVMACLVAGALVPAAGASGPESLPVLAGTNILKGGKSFTRQVILPAPATISDKVRNNPDIKIAGAGRVLGFSLVEADAVALPNELNGLRFRFCAYRGCKAGRGQSFLGMSGGSWDPTDDKDMLLKPGRYFLSLIADGGPTNVSFELHGLPGTATFKNGDPLVQTIGRAEKEFDSPTESIYAGGSVGRLTQNGVTMVAIQGTSETSAGGMYGACMRYRDRGQEQPPEKEWAPGCDLQGGIQAGGMAGGPKLPPAPERVVFAHWATAAKERISHGMWARTFAADVDMQLLTFSFAYPEHLEARGATSMFIGWDK